MPMKKILQTLVVLCLAVAPFAAFAQSGVTVSGTVTDSESGQTLPGANVYLVELQKGASTNVDGAYAINNVPAGSYTLKVSYVGYKSMTKTIDVGNSDLTLDFSIKPDFLGLDEVVVTGYGSKVQKGNLTSSISKVSAKDIANVTSTSANTLLQGKAAGVQVVQNSGTPGGGIMVRVRGSTSLTASNNPLYVVDGVPVNSAGGSNIDVGNQGLNAISSLSPSDIESIEVLKDASATAIYGARGANGVVLITTKSGSASKQTQFNANYTYGAKEFANQLDMLNTPDFMKMYVDGLYADIDNIFGAYLPLVHPYDNWGTYQDRYNTLSQYLGAFGLNFGSYAGLPALDEYGANPSEAPTYNWQDQVFQTGITHDMTFSAQGGDVKTQYYLSGNYYNERGIMIKSGFERLSGRLNLDHNINDRADIKAHVNYTRTTSNRIENDNNIYGVLTNAILSYPSAPIYQDNGSFNPNVGAFSNAVAAAQVQNDAVRTRFIGNLDANYDITNNLTVTGTMGLDRYDLKEDQFAPSFTNQGSPRGNAVSSVGFDQTWLVEGRVNYDQTFFKKHDINALGVISYQENQFQRTFSTGDKFPSDELRTINSAATTTGGSSSTSYGLKSFTGRVNYGYDNRYLLTLTGRVDGSSRFSQDNQYGFFPSASVGWRISNEKFMQNVNFVDELKLRASAGITGNQGIGNFSSLGLYGVVNYAGNPGVAPSQLENPDLKWEQTTQYDLGLDLTVLDSRVTFSGDYYLKDTNDLLLNRPIPSASGFTSFSSNIGSMENKGFEFSLSTINVQTRDLQWTTTLNMSFNRNKVTKLYKSQPYMTGFASRVQEGQPVGVFYGYVTDGIWNSQDEINQFLSNHPGYNIGAAGPGDVKFVDINGDGVVNSNDQRIIGNPHPDFNGGFTSDLSYKGFNLKAFFQFSYGNDIYNSSRQFYEHFGYSYTATTKANDAWTPNNTDTDVYRSSWYDSNNNTRDSDIFVEDGSYVRLKTLTLAYNFSSRLLDQMKLRSLRVFATGQNIWTSTKYSGLDPEVNTFDGSNTSLGTDFFVYPQARSIQLGINVGF